MLKQALSMGFAFGVVLVVLTPDSPSWLEVLAWVFLLCVFLLAIATLNAPKISNWCDEQLQKLQSRKK
ncbi:hypothetical protein JCM19231_2043 [Vibrio ishigakensis]|uniref:Uncharacterized protein n=1 Tax=Vibrio ishigakensis TaxID=1481914 RepID=A0A0B8NQP6_9VIBR|nr:hypothetical protein [Vibrio ishigakensis]GAM56895.1 hypothetical protein JCM19231_2043 [Vibrio ishigakensis]